MRIKTKKEFNEEHVANIRDCAVFTGIIGSDFVKTQLDRLEDTISGKPYYRNEFKKRVKNLTQKVNWFAVDMSTSLGRGFGDTGLMVAEICSAFDDEVCNDVERFYIAYQNYISKPSKAGDMAEPATILLLIFYMSSTLKAQLQDDEARLKAYGIRFPRLEVAIKAFSDISGASLLATKAIVDPELTMGKHEIGVVKILEDVYTKIADPEHLAKYMRCTTLHKQESERVFKSPIQIRAIYNTGEVKEFQSISQCAKTLGVSPTTINRCIRENKKAICDTVRFSRMRLIS